MYGLTDKEMDLYLDFCQTFAITEVTKDTLSKSKYITPLIKSNGKYVVDQVYVTNLLLDIEKVITLTTYSMAYEYAYLQCESELSESDIIKRLHDKYNAYIYQQFIRYGITVSSDISSDVVSQIILELPYLYAASINDEDFDGDEFLEEKLSAYNKYLQEQFPEEYIEEDDFDEVDEYDYLYEDGDEEDYEDEEELYEMEDDEE